jgi:hypothetical protein
MQQLKQTLVMTRSNKTFGNFIWQSQKNPITFVGYSIRHMNLQKQITVQTFTCIPACCCMICCMP